MSDIFRAGEGAGRADEGIDARPDELTGAYIVLLADDVDAAVSALRESAGVPSARHVTASDVGAALDGEALLVFDAIGVAVVTPGADREQSMLSAAAESTSVLAVEPERVVYAADDTAPADYLGGYRDGVNDLVARLQGTQPAAAPAASRATHDESRATWGLQATHVVESCPTGRGVRVAVLDTGIAPMHRDFADRVIKKASFIPGETVDDQHGHGTHCIGTACGPREPAVLPRYGIAGRSEIYSGKVLSNAGRGSDRGILAGINWAVAEKCRVVSMSLGSPTRLGDTYSRVYEGVAERALARGTIIVAAAGNESRRPGLVSPVSHPANCPSILAVAAVDRDLAVAGFSCAGFNPDGGQVDIAGPGVDVLSSVPSGHARKSGTSMATPHVAGILALLAESYPDATPEQLKTRLLAGAKRLPASSADVGAGLVQAP